MHIHKLANWLVQFRIRMRIRKSK